MRKSSKKSVYLTNVNLATRGKYRCEISAEAPSFVTAAKEEQLDINGKWYQFVIVLLNCYRNDTRLLNWHSKNI